ncbi:mechanosensitive ion channel family protein [Rhizobium sp. ARZ01]|uniref:mechanosensitive ion channel family protein n=1 Tax=Rhizobium sp. ARZ01 TaxID=2769313 RepID=UPI00177DAF19|nr:mechanosensitive ion channel family protein [Rhizobium sp. ARZ01]MBD9374812.1 mechanosensitive ion channel family protein [Rhizobium sp. ARZ01]
MSKFPAFLLCSLFSLLLVLSTPHAIAQTAPASNTPTQAAPAAPPTEKLAELLKLLDDPDIRNWIQNRPPASATSEVASEATLEVEDIEAQARSRFRALRAAIPNVPSEIAATAAKVRQQAGEDGFAPGIVLLLGIIAAGAVVEWLFRTRVRKAQFESAILTRAYAEFGPLLVFAFVAALIFLVVEWPPHLRVVILYALLAMIGYRFALGLCRLSLDVGGTSHFYYTRLRIFGAVLAFGIAFWAICRPLGVNPDVRAVITYAFSIVLLLLSMETVWRRPLDRQGNPPTRAGNVLSTLYLVGLWLLWCVNLPGLFWLGIYAIALPKILAATDRLTRAFALTRWNEEKASTLRTVLLVRGVRAVVILIAVGWLALVWRYNPNEIAKESPLLQSIVSGLFKSVIILLLADLAWQIAKTTIDRKLTPDEGEATMTPDEQARRARMRTLLPIFRNGLAVVVLCVAVMTILAEMGVQIGPLIAGAGIFGVAIGFGSQTLVKDIVSGIFYLMDDAFRVGEWIESGSYNGVVESFSLRSIRLRHHRGAVFTVPFGSLGAIRNGSRDWTVDKFRIRVPFKTDINKVGKIAKDIGKQLLEDPELGPHFIKPLKMKGVEQIGEFGIEISFGFTARPTGEQTAIRRRAYTMITQAFAENDISFAQPTFQVGGDEKEAAAAAAMHKHQADLAAQQAAAEDGAKT